MDELSPMQSFVFARYVSVASLAFFVAACGDFAKLPEYAERDRR
jgi:hypothetical protein